MNPTWPNVDNAWDLIGNLWIGVVVILVAMIPSWVANRRTHQSLSDIKNQVVNGHESPMRSDLDRVITAVDDLAREVRLLRTDLMAEENHRRIQINDLRDEMSYRDGNKRTLG